MSGSCAAVLLLFTGCGAFKASPAWAAATSLKVPGKGDYDQSGAYARAVSAELSRQGIENKVVTFRYSVIDGANAEKVITRSSVIYKDDTQPGYPWWLIDNLIRLPVWLPNGSVAEQVHFVTRYQPEILATDEGRAPVYVGVPAVADAPAAGNMDSLFLKLNGTTFDPNSAMDRRKMSLLQASR